MEKLALLILSAVISMKGYAQHFTIANTKNNVIYVGLANPISISVENYSNDSVWLHYSYYPEGVQLGAEKGEFTITPIRPGSHSLDIMAKKKGEIIKIGSEVFRVKFPPPPVAEIMNGARDSISLKTLRTRLGIMAVLYNFDYDCRYVIDGFTFSVIREGKEIYSRTVKSALFDGNIMGFLPQIKIGDIVTIKNISAMLRNGVKGLEKPIQYDLAPLYLKVVESAPSDNWKDPLED